MDTLKSSIKLIALALCILTYASLCWCAKRLNKLQLRDYLMSACSRMILRICGVRVDVRGALSEERPLLVVSNHISYVDVPLLDGHANLRFTPKSEIASWPLFGWICRTMDSVFITRKANSVKEAEHTIQSALNKGEAVCIFPEATTGNGLHLLPFKSSFFSLAEEEYNGRELFVQPVAITYTRIHNLPIGIGQWPEIAWYGDMDLFPHLWNFLSIAPVVAELTFLPPVTLKMHGDRKELALYCHKVIDNAIRGA